MPQGAKHDIHGSFWSKQRNWWLYPHDPGCSSSVMSTAYRLWCSFFHSKGSLKKHAIQKQLEKASVKLGHPTCKKTHAMQLEKQVKKKANEKARKKTKVVLFCCVFLRFFCRHPTPKRKNNLLFSFSIASFLLFVCVVFLLFSKVWFSGVLFWFAFVLGLFPSFFQKADL